MFGLLLIAALTVATLALASRLELLKDVGVVIGVSVLGGLLFLALHPDLAWIAEAPDEADATCGGEELAEPGTAAMERISVAEARELMQTTQVTFIDARPIDAYEQAHIPGALSLPAYEAEGLLDMQSLPITPEGRVITYCDGGRCEQSEYVGSVLSERGVCRRVHVLEGGWQAWRADEGPIVHGSSRYGDAPTSSDAPMENAG